MHDRSTHSPAKALQRLAEYLPGVTLEYLGKGDWMVVHGEAEYVGSAPRCLARLVEYATYPAEHDGLGISREEIASVIRLTEISDRDLTPVDHGMVSEVTLTSVKPDHINGGDPGI